MMNFEFTKNYCEDIDDFEFDDGRYAVDFNSDSYSNTMFNNFTSKINSPNYLSYETNEEFIEHFLKIGNQNNENLSSDKKYIDVSPQNNKHTSKETQNDSLSTFSSSKSHNGNIANFINNDNLKEKNIISFNDKVEREKMLIEYELKVNHEITFVNQNTKEFNSEEIQLQNHTSNNNSNLLGNKKGRPMVDKNVIFDEVTKKVYDPTLDINEYKKARKRMQNRESAVRSRQKKKENIKNIGADLDNLRIENVRLKQENEYLKNEKVFLVDQIKFMQNLIKSNNLVLVSNTVNLNNPNNASFIDINNLATSKSGTNTNIAHEINSKNKKGYDIEKNLYKENNSNITKVSDSLNDLNMNLENSPQKENKVNIYLNGKKQKQVGKIFSIFIICILSIFYISNSDSGSSEKISFNNNSIMNLNEYSDNSNSLNLKSFLFSGYLLHLFIILFIILLYFPIYRVMRRLIKYACGYFLNKSIYSLKIEKNL